MWFVFVAIGLLLLLACGLYVRGRIVAALVQLGVRERRVRIVRWMLVWLLYGYPVVVIVAVIISRLLDQPTIPRLDGLLASWLMGLPFILSALVVFQAVPWLIAIDVAYLIARRRRGRMWAARMRAVAVLGVVAAFGLYTPLRIVVEHEHVRIRHHDVATASATTPPLRIAFVADVQQDVHTDAARARALYARINASRPDVVLSGGDWINTGPDHIEAAAAAAGALTSRLGTLSVVGDHEHFAYVDGDRSVREVEQAMRRHGVVMASNEVRWFEHHGKRIAVVFLSYNYIRHVDEVTITTLVASAMGADYSIVVTHQLDRHLVSLLRDKTDLVLAAHTHGGQVNPVVGFVHVPLARLETRFIDGRYQLGTTTVIVTAGIGYSLVPIRYAAPGSLELIDLRL